MYCPSVLKLKNNSAILFYSSYQVIDKEEKEYVQQRLMRMGWKLTLPGVSVVPSVGHMRRPLYGGKTRHSR